VTFVGCRIKGCPTSGTGVEQLCDRHRREAGEGEAKSRWPAFVDNSIVIDECGAEVSRGALALRYVRDTIPTPQPDLSETMDPLALQKLDAERERKHLEEE